MLDPWTGSEEDEGAAGETWSEWPRCARCGQRRQAVCPTCHFAGEEIPLAEYLPPRDDAGAEDGAVAEDSSRESDLLLMCPGCDEAFAPRFYRICPHCGYDFGEGVEVEGEGAAAGDWNSRVVVMLAVAAIAVIGVLVYLGLLLRR